MSNLKYRLLTIAALIVASVWALYPRTVVERVQRNGVFVYDTVERVPLKRGLDLQGGMHLTLEIDESKQAVANKQDALDRALRVVRQRVDEFGVSEPIVQKVGADRIIVELPGIVDPQRAIDVVQKSAFLEFQITDKTQALERVVPRLDAIAAQQGFSATVAGAPAGQDSSKRSVGLEGLLTRSADSAKASGDSAGADTLAATVRGPFSRSLQQGQIPGQYMVAGSDRALLERLLANPAIQASLPPGKVVRWGTDSVSIGGQFYHELYVLDSRPIITGEYLTDARPNSTPIEGTIVEFQLNNEGGRRFKTETGRHIGDNMAIVLDDRVMTAPVIQGAIGTRGQITMGNNDLQDAQDLALVLRAGALPVPLKVAEVRNIGASLGEDAVDQGIRAGLLGLGLVIVIMIVYYKFAGFLAVAGLLLYGLITMAALAAFGATLTLPGIAGFLLSIGMAVDANFLQFERIREELDQGKSTRLAVDEGFKHSLSAIIDTHMTTALTALVLYQFGTGPVRGFAVTLVAGVAASMITAVFVVRTLFMVWLSRPRAATQPLSI
ncbi:MAG TPA: protein translocase subunit SecD [Gemmatimonadaceae bacterium]|jgi:preprotein translocase subunit SecD|nr:protein translocase subunit SecD [Gemmatimonadaceae bacterium]